MRKTIAKRMAQSKRDPALLRHRRGRDGRRGPLEVDLLEATEMFEEAITYNDVIVVRALALGATRATRATKTKASSFIPISTSGAAVAVEDGLIPQIHGCEQLSLLGDLTRGASARREVRSCAVSLPMKPSGATFSISNMGMLGRALRRGHRAAASRLSP